MEESKTYQHTCKVEDGGCGRTYTSLEADPYFCKDCIQSRKALYKQIEQKVGSSPKPRVKSDYETYTEQSKTTTQTLPDGTTVISSRMRV